VDVDTVVGAGMAALHMSLLFHVDVRVLFIISPAKIEREIHELLLNLNKVSKKTIEDLERDPKVLFVKARTNKNQMADFDDKIKTWDLKTQPFSPKSPITHAKPTDVSVDSFEVFILARMGF
jgi:hypothetical protein